MLNEYDDESASDFNYNDQNNSFGEENENKKVYSLLHYASSCGDVRVFEYVWKHCKNVRGILNDCHNETQETPLHFAVCSNNLAIVKLLIKEMR